jgi:hypothetical protein
MGGKAVSLIQLNSYRISKAKCAFSTRRIPRDAMLTLISGNIRPAAGDVVLATGESHMTLAI